MTDTAGCFGKLGYSTRAEAWKVRRHLLERRGYVKPVKGEVQHMQIYHCGCGRFHIGRGRRTGGKGRIKTAEHRKARYRELGRW